MKGLTLFPKRYFNSYHYQNSLLFQFIFYEFAAVYQQIEKITTSSDISTETFDQALFFLVGHCHSPLQVMSWSSQQGVMGKLRSYCLLWQLEEGGKNEKIQKLNDALNQAWIHMESLAKEVPLTTAKSLVILKKIRFHLTRAFTVLNGLLKEFADDENVLHFLIRYQQRWKDCFSETYLEDVFRKLFQEGTEKAIEFILKRYTYRGFRDVVENLEWLGLK